MHSGAMITVTSGHGDFRQLTDLPRRTGGLLTPMETVGGAMVVDSPDEVRLRVREQFMQGAVLIKLTAGGGVSSPFSPLDVTTFTEPELRAAVEIAENWGTYVAAHAFTSDAIRKAIAAGVKCIEHGFLMDEATARLIAENDIWLSLQPLPELMRTGLRDGSVERAKADEVWPGIGRTYELAKRYKIKTAWGTDVLFSRALAKQQGAILLRSCVGTRLPKRSSWRQRPMPNCWRFRANATPIRESWASSKKTLSRTSSSSKAIRWRISTWWPILPTASKSS